uniref:Uncharacterized protein n=1 Tax=Moniliophthora roreri TaxID=221103 RepID=A0A0W0G7M3_MONRR
MAPPLAGRPPFATDLPDSIYETPAPQRRIRQPAPPNPNDRTSAYDMYDNYLNDPAKNRQSGAGALGLGLLNGSLDDDDSDDEQPSPKQHQASPQASSKHAMLAAATGVGHQPPPPQYIAAPRPGYAAPISALNLARPEPVANPTMPAIRQPPASQNPFNPQPGTPALPNPFTPQPRYPMPLQNPFNPPRPNYSSPSPMPVSSTPHPLQPPVTPITPVFARPAKGIKFDEEPIMRSKTEDTFLPSRGQKGDDFWRRFSMVVHEQEKPTAQKKSLWLRKTQSLTNRMSWWVWIVGMLLVIIAGGAVALGWYISHNDTSQNQPGTLGGNAGASLHVSPTNTVARRAPDPIPTAAPKPRNIEIGSHASRKRHLNRRH